ncbi:NAD(P)H-dependent flavin oxidoreductase [Cellvibrio japonicus]|nr:nitronate monooxygenase [Cellvibrio japonicus]QEI11798.1 nitronate monooxygenase [Cellvibrio japonicus]QEI15372.1 nitronate monooxygenase [Cellvibrio japonicus]QEI18951.1 nitronate monooxygenase [Cellvibrio japonicus]
MYHPALYTPLTDILGCKFPILCAGMGGVARHQLAASVSNAGGFGCLGMVRERPEFIRKEVNLYRSLSDKPFAVNLIPAATDPVLLSHQIAECIALEIRHIVLFWDVDKKTIEQCRNNGIHVIHQVGSRRDAENALEAGADMLIVQGIEAGGHVRGETALFGLLPEICALSAVPVIASGGITTGEALVAALALGAQGISCGTLFLTTTESNAHDFHKEKIISATASDTTLCYDFQRNWPIRAAVRVLKNSITETATHHYKATPEVPIGTQDGAPIYSFSTDSPLTGAVGDLASMALYCGQGCGSVKHIKSAAATITDLMQQADLYLNRF